MMARIPDDQPIILPRPKSLEERREAYAQYRREERRAAWADASKIFGWGVTLLYGGSWVDLAYEDLTNKASVWMAIAGALILCYCFLRLMRCYDEFNTEMDRVDLQLFDLD